MRGVGCRLLLLTLLLLATVPALDLGAAAVRYGPAYVWRLIAWRAPTLHDDRRFPERTIAASTNRVPASWIAQATAPTPHVVGFPYGDDEFYGLLWWGFTRTAGPPDVSADGVFGQVLYVSRATGIVALRTGDGEARVDWPRVLRPLTDALSTQPAG